MGSTSESLDNNAAVEEDLQRESASTLEDVNSLTGRLNQRQLKQTVLQLIPSVRSEVDGEKVLLQPDSVKVTNNLPANFDSLRPFFSLESVQTENNRKKYTLKCLTCNANSRRITDKGITSFVRHLKVKLNPI